MMMMQQQKVKQNDIQRKPMTPKSLRLQSADRIGIHSMQPRYYNTGTDSSIYDCASCRTDASAYPQAPEYAVDAAPLRYDKNHIVSDSKIIQRVVIVNGKIQKKITQLVFTSISNFIREQNPEITSDPEQTRTLDRLIKKKIDSMIKQEQRYEFTNETELVKHAYDNLGPEIALANMVKEVTDKLSSFYTLIQSNIPNIIAMRPIEFEDFMLRSLQIGGLEIVDGAQPQNNLHRITRNYQSRKSSIAGTITYRYMYGPFSFFIEIHPKGGIHYGAYFLMEYSYGTKKAVKFIHSKSLTYLPIDEKQREAEFMHDDVPTDLMTDIQTIGHSPRQEGDSTSPAILQIPIAQIFRKKGMTAAGIWSEQTRASVEEQRDVIRRIRIQKIASLPVDMRILHIEYELLLIEKQLLSLELELIKSSSPTPERTSSIGSTLERIGSSLDDLEEHIRHL